MRPAAQATLRALEGILVNVLLHRHAGWNAEDTQPTVWVSIRRRIAGKTNGPERRTPQAVVTG